MSLDKKYFLFEAQGIHLWSHYELGEEDREQAFHIAQDCS